MKLYGTGYKKSEFNIKGEIYSYEDNIINELLVGNVDLIDKYMPPMYDSQLNTGRCTLWSLSALLEYMYNKNSVSIINFPQVYSNTLSKNFSNIETKFDNQMNYDINLDSGLAFIHLFKSIMKHGMCNKIYHDDDPDNMFTFPNHEAMNDGPSVTIQAFYKINTLEGTVDCLNRGIPVIFAYDSKIAIAAKDNGHLPNDFDWEQDFEADHANLLIGFNNGIATIRNSWGPDFGDDGYFHVDLENFFDNSMVDCYCVIVENETFISNPKYFEQSADEHNLPSDIVILNDTAYDIDFANNPINSDLIREELVKTDLIILVNSKGKMINNRGQYLNRQTLINTVGQTIRYNGNIIKI